MVAQPQDQPKAAPPPERQIALYASRGEISEAKARFKAGLKIQDASDHEYAALAHLCVKWNLDPFNGEAYIIPNNGVMVGIKGLRKMANRQAERQGIRWWIEFLDVRSADEAKQYGIPDGATHAVVCHLRRSDTLKAYTETMLMLQKAGNLPFEQLMQILGKPPVVVGIGFVKAGEKSKMPLPQLARKRAEAHAIKQTWDVEDASEGDLINDRIADADWVASDYEMVEEDDAPVTEIVEDGEEVPSTPKPSAAAVGAQITGVATALINKGTKPEPITFDDLRAKRPQGQLEAVDLLRRASGDTSLTWKHVEDATRADGMLGDTAKITPQAHWALMIDAIEDRSKKAD